MPAFDKKYSVSIKKTRTTQIENVVFFTEILVLSDFKSSMYNFILVSVKLSQI